MGTVGTFWRNGVVLKAKITCPHTSQTWTMFHSRFVQTCDLRRETPGTGPWRERPVTDKTQVTCVTPAVPKRQVSIAVQVSITQRRYMTTQKLVLL